MVYGKPLPIERAVQYLRQGMKMIRFELMEDDGRATWLSVHFFPADTPVKLIWRPGLDWQSALDGIQASPSPWNETASLRFKYLAETARQIALEKGFEAAQQWMEEEQKRGE